MKTITPLSSSLRMQRPEACITFIENSMFVCLDQRRELVPHVIAWKENSCIAAHRVYASSYEPGHFFVISRGALRVFCCDPFDYYILSIFFWKRRAVGLHYRSVRL